MNVAVIGLGKLGLPLAAWLASRGHQVSGIDVDVSLVDALRNNEECPVQETGLPKLLEKIGTRFHASHHYYTAVYSSEITFVVVPTPSLPKGDFSLEYVLEAVRQIGEVLRDVKGYRLVVVVSTVMPGHMEQVKTALESASGKRCGQDFGLCYNPEFVALGSVLRDLEHPDFVLIGESDALSGKILARRIYPDKKVFRTNLVDAEIAKLAINSYVTMKITFACMMARIAEKVPGADVDVISDAVGMDSRIGRKYLTGGDGFGGPCFPRDNQALAQLAYSLAASARLPRTVIQENEELIWAINSRIFEVLKERESQTVLILGMAYKPGTSVTEQSQGLALKNGLKSVQVAWYDPMVPGSIKDVRQAIETSGVVVIMQPCPEFKAFDYGDTPVIDLWRFLRDCPPKNWVPMGIGATSA